MSRISLFTVIHLLSLFAGCYGDFNVLSQQTHNQTSVAAVVSAFYQNVYVVFYIKSDNQEDQGVSQSTFSARVFELRNSTLVPQLPVVDDSNYLNTDVVLETRPNSFGGTFSFSVLACRSLKCSIIYVYMENGKYTIYNPARNENLCLKTGTYSLKAVDSNDRSLQKLVIIRNGELIAFMCAGQNTYEYKLVCSDGDTNFNELKAVKTSSSPTSVHILALLTGQNDRTALCLFTITKRSLPASRSITGKTLNSNQKLVISDGGSRQPIGLAVISYEQHHLAFVLHSDGHLSKVGSFFTESI